MGTDVHFHDFESQFDCPPLTEDALREAERDLNVCLPSSLVELLRQRNGGLLFCSHPLPNGEVREVFEQNSVGILGIMGICASSGMGKKRNDLLRANWGYPENTVIFSHASHAGFALDYRKGSPPSVIYVCSEMYPRVLIEELAPNFDAFLDGLMPMDFP